MRKLLILVVALLVAHVALLFNHPSGAAAPQPVKTKDVVVDLDLGGPEDNN
jgi:hypothetical protein